MSQLENRKYVSFSHTFSDPWSGDSAEEAQDVTLSFRFAKPTKLQIQRLQDKAAKNAGQASRNLVLDCVHPDDRQALTDAMEEYPGEYELITPSVSILCQPSVAVVDEVTRVNGTRRLATEYLNYLYSDEAQHLAAEYYYRPSNQEILAEYSDRFDLDVELVTIDDFGGWAEAQARFFSDGGEFDQIYENLDPED